MKMKNYFRIPAILFVFMFIFMAAAPAGPPGGAPAANAPGSSAKETIVLAGNASDINGEFKVSLPLPGASRESTFTLSCDGSKITGMITNPYSPDQSCEIYNGTADGNRFKFSVKVGRTEYNFEGTAGGGKLSMTLTTNEAIPLGDGTKIKTSKETAIDGAYLVPVYSPGGVMENIFFLKSEGNVLTGQMVMISNPMRDKSDFFDGTVNGKEISLYTRTPQSLFHFVGTVEGDIIKLNLLVTDVSKGIEGQAVK